ncbi:MAG: YfiM family protein [Ignavibacteriaceae bacterium]|nr:YfiM family protein [Ignavibacteriaceae bacterium]
MKQIIILFFIVLSSVAVSQVIPEKRDTTILMSKLEILNSMSSSTSLSYEMNLVEKYPSVDVNAQNIDYLRLGLISTVTLGSGLAVHIYQANAWWKDQRTPFKIVNDWEYALWIDKIGHFYATSLLQHGFSAALEGAGFNLENSAWIGAGTALGYQLFIEIEDGFGPQWGFSPGDAVFDLLGASYPVFQHYYPFLKNFQMKFSYYPVDLNKVSPKSGQRHIMIDDYSGQKFWLSFRMKNLLPYEIAKIWPSWLALAVGYGVKNLDGSGGGQKDVYIAMDLDLEALPLHGKTWGFIKNTLNYAHFPMPGIRITNNVAFFGLCY